MVGIRNDTLLHWVRDETHRLEYQDAHHALIAHHDGISATSGSPS
jgi:hypothetical protein